MPFGTDVLFMQMLKRPQHFFGVLIAQIRIRIHRLFNDLRHKRADMFPFGYGTHFQRVFGRTFPGQKMVQCRAQTVNVRADIQRDITVIGVSASGKRGSLSRLLYGLRIVRLLLRRTGRPIIQTVMFRRCVTLAVTGMDCVIFLQC